jgi:hypothetical protein
VHVTFSQAMPDTNYSVEVTPEFDAALNGDYLVIGIKSTTGVDVVLSNTSGSGTTLTTSIPFDWGGYRAAIVLLPTNR